MIWVDQAYNMVEMQERKGPVVISVPVDYSHNHLLIEPPAVGSSVTAVRPRRN
jgi:hypothetical protein